MSFRAHSNFVEHFIKIIQNVKARHMEKTNVGLYVRFAWMLLDYERMSSIYYYMNLETMYYEMSCYMDRYQLE